MLVRVSNIETFRRWRNDPEQDVADLVARLTDFQPSESMLAGTAFHKALEVAPDGSYDRLEADGYTFLMPEAEIALPKIRELRCYEKYGPITVTGQVDGFHGKRIDDHKTTAQFSGDGYWEGCQWRFYLDIFGADVFRWNVFPITPVRGQPKTYTVAAPQILEQCRYPSLHDDCQALVSDYYAFAIKHLTETQEWPVESTK